MVRVWQILPKFPGKYIFGHIFDKNVGENVKCWNWEQKGSHLVRHSQKLVVNYLKGVENNRSLWPCIPFTNSANIFFIDSEVLPEADINMLVYWSQKVQFNSYCSCFVFCLFLVLVLILFVCLFVWKCYLFDFFFCGQLSCWKDVGHQLFLNFFFLNCG